MTRDRKLLVSITVAMMVAGGLLTTLPTLLWGESVDYSQVASIKGEREYQDTVLLEKGWSLPVASLYRRHIEYQHNASFCGPASIANVLRSLNRTSDQSTVLQGTNVLTVLGYVPGGVTLDQLAEIARHN